MADRASRATLRKTVEALLDDESFITSTHAEITRKKWALGELNSAVALQCPSSGRGLLAQSKLYRNQLSISEEQIQDLVLLSITGSSLSKDSTASSSTDGPTGGAFIFLVVRILAFRQKTIDALFGEEEDAVAAEADAAAGDVVDNNAWDDEVDIEFREYVVQQLHNLGRHNLGHAAHAPSHPAFRGRCCLCSIQRRQRSRRLVCTASAQIRH